jgi:hypothetical protein
VFLLGRWKNYDEMEEDLTVEELLAAYNAIFKKENRFTKVIAAMWGADIGDDEDEGSVQARDITSLTGYTANKVGFGIENGIGYEILGAE